MNLIKSKLGATLLLAASASMAQASTYNVSAVFADGGMQGQTVFNGSFDWNGSSVSNFRGLLSESMFGWNGTAFDSNGTGASGSNGAAYSQDVYAKPGGYAANEAPLLNLTHQLASSTAGNLVTVSTFLKPTTDVVSPGGYNVTGGNSIAFGNPNPANRTNNAFFTLVFDVANLVGSWDLDPNTALTEGTTRQMVYGDMTALGMMGPMLTGWVGMTGYDVGGNYGSMGGAPTALSIALVPPTAVPLPAAAWLFGGALMSLFGANRRKQVLPRS
jgi:hypothetical protein